jgi:hypothetical protein
MRYKVDFGDRSVVVALSRAEHLDVMRMLELRGPRGPGGPDGPVAHGYAVARASKELPGFHFTDVCRVAVH